MDKEAKVFLGFAVGMVALVIAGAVLLSKSSSTANTNTTPEVVTDSSYLIRDNSNKLGKDDAKVKFVEFGDFQCPACGSANPIVKTLLAEYPDDVQFIFRNFPLISIHPNARPAAIAVEAAGVQGKYWEMFNKVFETQDDWSEARNAEEIFVGFAKELKLDEQKFKDSLKNSEITKKIDQDMSDGDSLGVNSTPSFFINGTKYAGGLSYDQLKASIESALQK